MTSTNIGIGSSRQVPNFLVETPNLEIPIQSHIEKSWNSEENYEGQMHHYEFPLEELIQFTRITHKHGKTFRIPPLSRHHPSELE